MARSTMARPRQADCATACRATGDVCAQALVDAITTICEGMRRIEIVARGIPLNKVTVMPRMRWTLRTSVVRRMTRSGSSWVCKARKWLVTWVPSNAYEGLDVLINAVPRILEHAPDTRFLLVGGGPQEAALKRQSQMLGVDDKVVFTGRVPHSEDQVVLRPH